MAVTLTQNPGDFNLAYGANAITLSNLSLNDRKYVLRIMQGNTILSDIRQHPNTAGHALFDVQNILQSFVEQSPGNIESDNRFTDSRAETFYYQIAYGSESATGGVVIDGTSALKLVVGGVKDYYTVLWDSAPYTAEVSGDEGVDNCTTVTKVAKGLTDMPVYPMSQFSGGKPQDFKEVYNIKATDNDQFTISYWNQIVRGTIQPPATNVQQAITAIKVDQFNGQNFIASDALPNIVGDGGGPDTFYGEGLGILWPFHALTHGCGPNNGSFTLSKNTTHYYVYPVAWNSTDCSPDQTSNTTAIPLRVDIVEPNCNDYDHLQFSWTNSFGFRDYFTFTKKNSRSVNVKRNTYFKEAADYAATFYSVDSTNRGTTTYSQLIKEQHSAFTDYITDTEAAYLERMFTAPDLRVKIEGTWFPVVSLTNSYTEKTYRKDRLFQYDIRFELAHPLKSQRG